MEKLSEKSLYHLREEICFRTAKNCFNKATNNMSGAEIILQLQKDLKEYAAAYLDEAMKVIMPKEKFYVKPDSPSEFWNLCLDEILQNAEKFKRGDV